MPSLPKWGIVRWRDATSPHGKVRKDRLTKNLPVREDIGWLFADAEGTIQVLHNRIGREGQTRFEDREYTLIPAAWVVEIIPLIVPTDTPKKVEGIDAVEP